jgi:hypothetical protein
MLKRTQIILMTCVLLIYGGISFYTYPQADDYWYAVKYFNNGFLQTQINEYMGWNGRYVATAVLSGSPLIWGNLFHYRLLPILLLVFLFLSSSFMIKKVFKDKLGPKENWFYGLALTYLTITGYFALSQGLYWLSGAYTYTLSLIFFNFAFGYFWSFQKSLKENLLVCFFAFLLIGCNETMMVLWLLTITLREFFLYLELKQVRKDTILIFVFSFIMALVVLKAPGNAVRAGFHTKSHQVLRTVGNAFVYSFVYPIKFATISLVVLSILNFESLRSLFDLDWLRKYRKWLSLSFLFLIFISFAPSLWGMGRKPNERTMNIIIFFYFLGFFPVLFSYVQKIPESLKKPWPIFFLLFSMNNLDLVTDFFGPFQFYQDRWKRIIETKGDEIIHEDKRPKSIRFNDIEAHTGDFKTYLSRNHKFFE